MKHRSVVQVAGVVVVLAWLFCSLSPAAAADDVAAEYLLFPCEDESTVEQQIGKYLEKRREWKIQYELIGDEKDDLILRIGFSTEDEIVKSKQIIIDTQVTGQDGGQTTERAIRVFVFVSVPEAFQNARSRQALLEFTNNFMDKQWSPGRVCIDQDFDLLFETWVNIPSRSTPVHCEMIYDAAVRLLMAIDEYMDQLAEDPECGAIARAIGRQE